MARTSRTAAAVATGAVALGLGLGAAGLASAAPTTSPSPSATPSAGSTATPGTNGPADGRGGRFHGDRDALAQQLADKLGADVAEVRTALQEYREANRPTTPPDAGTRPEVDDTALAKALAEKLGVDEAKVATALTEVRAAHQAERAQAVADRLAEAVKAGTLTQAEADAVKKAADAGIVHVGGR